MSTPKLLLCSIVVLKLAMCQEALGIIVISHLIHTLTMRSAVLAVLIVMVYVTSIAGLIARPQSRRLTSLKATSMKKPHKAPSRSLGGRRAAEECTEDKYIGGRE